MLQNAFDDDKSILVQVMTWCRMATRHYLNVDHILCWHVVPLVTMGNWYGLSIHHTYPLINAMMTIVIGVDFETIHHRYLHNGRHGSLCLLHEVISHKQAMFARNSQSYVLRHKDANIILDSICFLIRRTFDIPCYILYKCPYGELLGLRDWTMSRLGLDMAYNRS